MPLYQAIILAAIQGLTEFLPISSTAHLALFPWLLHWEDPGLTFDVALHAGTLVAVLSYFWREWLQMLFAAAAIFRNGLGRSLQPALGSDPGARISRTTSNPRRIHDPETHQMSSLFWYLVIGTVPAGIAGFFFEHAAETRFREPAVIGTALIVVALLMWAGERVTGLTRGLKDAKFVDSLFIGGAQAFAIIPGVSRSGITMTAGLFRGMNREAAARFSFLLSTPVIAGAVLKKGLEIRHEGLPAEMRLPFLVGAIVAALVGYLVIAGLIRYLGRHTFKIFVIYRILLGVIVLLLGWGVASPTRVTLIR